jgi:hypothetical protein
MTVPDSINAGEREFAKRLVVVVIFLVVFTAAFAHLHRVYSDKFFGITGQAQWIWAQHRMAANEPVAFFAVREFDLPERRIFTHLKVVGDPEYTVYLNGSELAGRLLTRGRQTDSDDRLDFYDVSALVRTGRNRIVVAVRAPQGIGGLIAAIDIAPETENWLVTDGSWKIYRWWYPDLLQRDPPRAHFEAPLIVGTPPVGRWNYLEVVRRAPESPLADVVAAKETFEAIGLIPAISTRGGIAVAVTERERATAFDFGFTRGRLRLTRDRSHFSSRAVNVRFAFARPELGFAEWNLRPIVFAPGELTVTTPEAHDFRYAMVFARGVRAEVVREEVASR